MPKHPKTASLSIASAQASIECNNNGPASLRRDNENPGFMKEIYAQCVCVCVCVGRVINHRAASFSLGHARMAMKNDRPAIIRAGTRGAAKKCDQRASKVAGMGFSSDIP